MSLSNSAIRTIATYYPDMRREPRCQHALTIYLNATSVYNLNAQIRQYPGCILHVTLHGGDVGRMERNEHVDVFLTITDVTSIGEGVFNRCDEIRHVTFPSSLETIEDFAFCGCWRMKSLTLPDGLTTIGKNAFRHCDYIQTVKFPDSLQSIGDSAFSGCVRLNAVTFPSSLRTIGKYAFYVCSRLERVTFPNTLSTIGKGAFEYCTRIKTVTIPSSVTSIGEDAFPASVEIIRAPFPNTALRF